MSNVPSEQYTTRWADDRPFVGERSLVVFVPDQNRTDLPLRLRDDPRADGCSVSIRDAGGGVEIEIWCGGMQTTGPESEI